MAGFCNVKAVLFGVYIRDPDFWKLPHGEGGALAWESQSALLQPRPSYHLRLAWDVW